MKQFLLCLNILLLYGGVESYSTTYTPAFVVDNYEYTIANYTDSTVAISGVVDTSLLPHDLVIPSTVTYNDVTYTITNILSGGVFIDCENLTSVSIPNTITDIGAQTFENCTNLVTVRLPNTLGKIQWGCFEGCKKLTSIELPNTIKALEGRCFARCSSLTSITIPEGVTTMDCAFEKCTGLMYVVVPSTVTQISNNEFSGSGVRFLKFRSETPPYISGNMPFSDCPNLQTIYVPCGYESTYRAKKCWSYASGYIESLDNVIVLSSNHSAWGTTEVSRPNTCDNSIATIEATAREHYCFETWSDGNTDNPRTMTIFQDTILTAFFKIQQHTITLSSDNPIWGVVMGAGTYDYDSIVEIRAIPTTGYEFVKWSDDNTDNPRLLSVTQDSSLTAFFKIQRHTVTLSCDAIQGSVEGSGTYDYGMFVEIKAIPKTGYEFVKWSDDKTENPRTISVIKDTTLTACFRVQQHTITLSCDTTRGIVSGAGQYSYGDEVEITATPREGYVFSQWSDGNDENPRTIMVTVDVSLTAHFEVVKVPDEPDTPDTPDEPDVPDTPDEPDIKYYIVSLSCDSNQGIVTGGGRYQVGTWVDISATPQRGYEFGMWSDGDLDAERTLQVNVPITLTAYFRPRQTPVEDVSTDDSDVTSVRKVLREGLFLIIRGSEEYSITGVRMK